MVLKEYCKMTKKILIKAHKFVSVFFSKKLAIVAFFVYNGIVVTNVYWRNIQYKSIDETGGCRPTESGFSAENVRFTKPGGSHASIRHGIFTFISMTSVCFLGRKMTKYAHSHMF